MINNNKRYIDLAIECLRNKNINNAIIYINKVIDDLKGINTDLEDIENVVAYYDLKNVDNNKTKTNIIINKISNNNNISIDNMDYTYGNAKGYTGWTNLGLQLSNPNSLVNMDYINCKSVEINFNSLNYFIRNNMFILAMIDDENNEYILKSFCWGKLVADIYNKTDDTELISMPINQSQTFEEGDYNFHSAILSFENNGIQTYVDGQKQVFTNIGKNIVGAKLYTSDKYYTNMPYRSLKFYNYNQTEETALKNYNTFIKYINTTGYEDKPYSSQTEFNTLDDLLNSNLKLGSKVSTKGYLIVGDNGGAKYNIVNYDTYFNSLDETSRYISRNGSNTSKCDVDGFGNHYMKNGYIAMLDLEQGFFTPEMFGAKGDGLSNDTEPFINLFGIVKKGNINLKDGATYMIGSRKAQEKSYGVDNKYVYPLIGTFVGGCHRPLIANCNNLVLDGNPSNDGNKATLKIPDNDFGFGMGMLNLAGHIEGLEIKNIIFDSNGLSMKQTSVTGSDNKTSNHTIVYSPASKDSDNSILNDLNIHHCKFLANGTDISVSDSGGDDILIINPIASKNVWIEDNEFYDWGRWVYSVDLGGSGETFFNYKFNRNICIQGENNRHTDVTTGLRTGGYRGLGWIDFEAKKCWTGLEVNGNYVRGLAGFAMNGNGKTLIDATFSNNDIETISREYRSAYPYFINWYSVRDVKNFVCENNTLNTGYSVMPSRYAVDGCIFRNNHITGEDILFLHGLYGDIIIDSNIKDNRKYILITDDNLYLPSYLSEVEEKHCNFVFTNNNGGIKSGSGKESLLYKPSQPGEYSFINITIENNDMDSCIITTFDSPFELDPAQLTQKGNGDYVFRGAHFTGPTFTNNVNNPVCCSPIFKAGELVAENVNMNRMELAYYYTSQIEKGKTYNIYCTEEGYFPLAYKDVYLLTETPNKKVSLNTFYYTKENLYVVVKEGTLGTAEEIQSINHTNGVMTCGTAELRFVTKLGKYRAEKIS